MLNKRDLKLDLQAQGYDAFATITIRVAIKNTARMTNVMDLINEKVGSLPDENWGQVGFTGNIEMLGHLKPRRIKKTAALEAQP